MTTNGLSGNSPTELNRVDRCDYCMTRAIVRVILPPSPDLRGNGELLFCGHHFEDHSVVLGDIAIAIYDERVLLQVEAMADAH